MLHLGVDTKETIYGSKTPQEHYIESQKWLAFIQAPMLAFLGKYLQKERKQERLEMKASILIVFDSVTLLMSLHSLSSQAEL